MYKLNLIILRALSFEKLSEECYKDNTTRFVFDDDMNYGLGCTGVCTECMYDEDEDYDYIPF